VNGSIQSVHKRSSIKNRIHISEKWLTMSIAFHSLLRILLISPVRIIWLAADTSGLRLRAKIMNAFIGRFGVPSASRDWATTGSAEVELSLSSVRTGTVEKIEKYGDQWKTTAGAGPLELRWIAVRRIDRVGAGAIWRSLEWHAQEVIGMVVDGEIRGSGSIVGVPAHWRLRSWRGTRGGTGDRWELVEHGEICGSGCTGGTELLARPMQRWCSLGGAGSDRREVSIASTCGVVCGCG